jgi:hypothetical protein
MASPQPENQHTLLGQPKILAGYAAEDIQEPSAELAEPAPKAPRGLQFWLIILSGCLVDFATALGATITTTALPKITIDFKG